MSFENVSSDVTLAEVYGEVQVLHLLFPRHGEGKNPIENRVIKCVRGYLLGESYSTLTKNSRNLSLIELGKLKIKEIPEFINFGQKSVQWLHEYYASHANPVESKMEKPAQVDPLNKIKRFCVFKVDGVTYLKYNYRIIPFSDILELNFFDEENRQVQSLLQKQEGKFPVILAITYKTKDEAEPIKRLNITEREVDDVELQKLIDIFNTY
jgi:hypothetical protein